MTMPSQFQVINPPVQNPISGAHLHTPQSIFQHMMGQQNNPHEAGSWAQMPQVPPMYMPWSVPSLQQSQLVRFTGEQQSLPCGPILHQKRKLDIPDSPAMRPAKQFISEEKMAAHFRNMHISTNYNATPSTSADCNAQPSTSGQIDLNVETPANIEDGKSMHPRLVISEELKRLQQEPLLPASLLSKLDRPSMALVLWEPPSKHLRMLSTRLTSRSTTAPEDDNNNNNNNSSNNNNDNNNEQIADMNELPFEPNDVELEPMDL